MGRQRSLIEIALWTRLVVEIAMAVDAPDQCCRIANLGLADIGWDVADRQSNTPIVGTIGFRPVHELDVMERHLARLQDAIDRLRGIDLHGDLLSARQE